MDLREDLLSCFQFLNVTLTDEVLKLCEELCISYEVQPEDFVNIWCAYAAGSMSTAAPTLESLQILERKKLQKFKSKSAGTTPVRTPKREINGSERNVKMGTTQESNLNSTDKSIQEVPEVKQEILSEPFPEPEILDVSISSHLCTQDISKYSERKNSLLVRVSIGQESCKHVLKKRKDVKLINEEIGLTHERRYMYEVLGAKAACLGGMASWIQNTILKKNNLTISSEAGIKNYIGPLITAGRILVDGKGHLNLQSIMLEGTDKINMGYVMQLNIDRVPRVALFPGQIVVVKGKMLSGSKLIVENIYTDASLDLPLEPPVIEEPLRVILAAGPYTLDENLNYDPMRDLLNYVADKQPDVLILMGPFVDLDHPLAKGMPDPFPVFFDNLMESISAALQDTEIQIIIISSNKEIHHHNVYPTPPYKTKEKHDNITFFSDPCVLKIDGLVLGIGTTDILYQVAKEELVTAKDSDTMSRLASHIIQQQSFYPLYPPNGDVRIHHQFLESYGMMEYLPHLLILPSTFRGFIKNIKECVVLNPERLTRSNGGGAFADIIISPGSTQSISNRTFCKILNI